MLRELKAGLCIPHMLRRHRHGTQTWADAAPPSITCPHDVVTLLADEMGDLSQEQLRVILLNTKNRVLACEVIYQGTVQSITIRAAEVLRPAVLTNAPSVIVVHNHPSGDPTPSAEDVRATNTLMAAGDLLDVAVLDHIVLGSGGRYASLRERGLVSSHIDHPDAA